MMRRRLQQHGAESAHKAAVPTPFTERGLLTGAFGPAQHAMTTALVAHSPIRTPVPIPVPPLSELVREHTPYVWRVLRSLGVRETDIEDVCQETFIVVHRRLHTFEGRASLRSWIYGIALRVVSDYRNKAHRRREVLTSDPPDTLSSPVQETLLESKRAWHALDRLLARLSEEQREVFVLYELEEMSMREVSEIIGCPLQTAYSRLHAARKLVQDRLKRLRADGAAR
jgi:RNA polymerase sigma-70 factor (ECF subfamily)